MAKRGSNKFVVNITHGGVTIQRQVRGASGRVKFSDTVNIGGDLAGRDIYALTETPAVSVSDITAGVTAIVNQTGGDNE